MTHALALMNGPFIGGLNNRYTTLSREIRSENSPKAKIESVYLSLLNRYPLSEEVETLLPLVKARDLGPWDAAWAVINTQEFIFVR